MSLASIQRSHHQRTDSGFLEPSWRSLKWKRHIIQPIAKLISTIILSLVLSGCSGTPDSKADQTTGETPVPYRYRSLYNELYTKLNSLSSSVNAGWDGKKSDVNFGVELLVTNSNRGGSSIDRPGTQGNPSYPGPFKGSRRP